MAETETAPAGPPLPADAVLWMSVFERESGERLSSRGRGGPAPSRDREAEETADDQRHRRRFRRRHQRELVLHVLAAQRDQVDGPDVSNPAEAVLHGLVRQVDEVACQRGEVLVDLKFILED